MQSYHLKPIQNHRLLVLKPIMSPLQVTQLRHAVDDAMHQASHGAIRHGLSFCGDEVKEFAIGDGLHHLSPQGKGGKL